MSVRHSSSIDLMSPAFGCSALGTIQYSPFHRLRTTRYAWFALQTRRDQSCYTLRRFQFRIGAQSRQIFPAECTCRCYRLHISWAVTSHNVSVYIYCSCFCICLFSSSSSHESLYYSFTDIMLPPWSYQNYEDFAVVSSDTRFAVLATLAALRTGNTLTPASW